MFKIEKDVPLPEDFKVLVRFPWAEQFKKMKNGDSIFVPGEVSKSTLDSAASNYRKTLPQEDRDLFKAIVIPMEEKGVKGHRVWIRIFKPEEEHFARDSEGKKNDI